MNEGTLIKALVAAVCVTRETAEQLYAKWSRRPTEVQTLFEKHIGSNRLLADVVIEARVTPDTAERLYKKWQSVSMRRGRRALMKAREKHIAELKGLS